MANRSGLMIASAVAIGINLTACGGGSGGGPLVSTPVPPPPPPPPPGVASIGAPAQAVVPNANLFPDATIGGPTMRSHSMTVFPLLHSVVAITSSGLVADTATMTGGATLGFDSSGSSYVLNVGNPALGVANVALNPSSAGSRTLFQADLPTGGTAFVNIADPATSNLSWTTYGFWNVHTSTTIINAPFVTGYETPAGSVPTTGTATYRGSVIGEAFHPPVGQQSGASYYALSGDATFQANFGSGTITGNLTNMITTSFEGDTAPWNSVSLLGAISGGNFSGTSAASSAPTSSGALSGSATGTFAGMFFGTNAQELGAVWTLHDGTASAIGSIGASNDPSCSGCWDY